MLPKHSYIDQNKSAQCLAENLGLTETSLLWMESRGVTELLIRYTIVSAKNCSAWFCLEFPPLEFVQIKSVNARMMADN